VVIELAEVQRCPLSACDWSTTESPTCARCGGAGSWRASALVIQCAQCMGTGQVDHVMRHLRVSHSVVDFMVEIDWLRSQIPVAT
jgi:DnaJ-class molecular chaperone